MEQETSDRNGNGYEHVGSLIKAERKRQGMTMLELAAKTGLSQSAISMIENGVRQTTPQTLSKMGEALGVNFNAADSNKIDNAQTKKRIQSIDVSVLGFTMTLDIRSFESDLQDEPLIEVIGDVFTVEVERVLNDSSTLERLGHIIKDALKIELDKKKMEVRKISDIIDG